MPLLLALAMLAGGAEWTVGIYMAADNGLNDQSWRDLAEIAAAGGSDNVRIVVQVDRAARDSVPGCRRYLVRNGGLELLADLGTVDMAEPATLGEFGAFLARSFPARRCGLVLWDHGTGWGEGYGGADWLGNRGTVATGMSWSDPAGPRQQVDAIIIDESHRHMMGVAGGELAAGLEAFRSGWGRQPDVLGFDACLMGMVEVAGEAVGRAGLMVASEGLVPTGGWPYDAVLGRLTARPQMTPEEFVAVICSEYAAAWPDEPVTIAAIDLERLTRSMNGLAAWVGAVGGDVALRAARQRVQTFACAGGRPPFESDESVDLLHLLELAGAPESVQTRLGAAVRARASSGSWYANARGLACWFPSRYLSFKALHQSYAKLDFARRVGWLAMLNRYFGCDDIRPTQPELAGHRFGHRGRLRLWWHRSRDLAPVRYCLWQAEQPDEVFSDDCEGFGNWIAVGWTASSTRFRSGFRSFFSGSGANLDNFIESAQAFALPAGGVLSFYAWYQTRETEDSGRISRDAVRLEWAPRRGHWRPVDSLYGSATEWQERRWVLPAADSVYLRFRFSTGGSVTGAGCYIDDIKVWNLAGLMPVASSLADTTFELVGLARRPAGYRFFVTAVDSFGNVSSASQFYTVPVETRAEPYTVPAPFSGPCRLVLDIPDSVECRVSIYTLSGVLVRQWREVTGRELVWDGCNQSGRRLAGGVYLVLVEGDDFRQTGRIASTGQ